MADAAQRQMTIEEFLTWDDGTDTRYELRGGVLVAMSPGSRAHQRMIPALAVAVGGVLRGRKGCEQRSEAGILSPTRDLTYYVVDLLITCSERDRETPYAQDPILIVEVLSKSTERVDRRTKLPDFRAIPSVEEILLIDPEKPHCEVHRRTGDGRWLVDLIRGRDQHLVLESIGLKVPLSELYPDIPDDDL
ncbi:Uma2 family endonuclease [Zavarzinia sp. CC-PAN008]|uniref:Uma2 family endonuclease n=1 Tax=Zavarzinia sp. CC-PAN008 TaxID=3243332 RepID=UPI003F747083